MALPKVYRLTIEKHTTGKLRKSGKAIHTTFLATFSLPNNQKTSRFGIVIGTNISKKAAERNRIRRIVQEALLENVSSLTQSFDVIIYPKKVIAQKENRDIKSDCQMLLKQL